MPIASYKQFNGRVIDRSLDYIVVVEPFKVTGLAGNINNISAGLPALGTAHSDSRNYPGAVVSNHRLKAWINKDTALAEAVYRRNITGYSGGPRRITRSSSYRYPINIPVWRKVIFDNTLVGWDLDENVFFQRMIFLRQETRFIPGNAVNAVQNAVIQNAGLFYDLDGYTYRLSDQTSAAYDGVGYTRADYVLEYPAPMYGIPQYDPEYGNDIEIPFLPAHYKWIPRKGATSIADPSVLVKAPAGPYGGALPGPFPP